MSCRSVWFSHLNKSTWLRPWLQGQNHSDVVIYQESVMFLWRSFYQLWNMLLSVPREILRTYSSTCVALKARRFSQFASRRSQTSGIFYISPCWLHSKRQVQRSHTRENVAAHTDNSSSSLKSVYQNVKETLSRVTEKTEPISSVAELAVRYITVHSLTDFYIECPHGILFDACYVDSHPDGVFCADLKTVVILPGSPGSHLDVLPLMRPLAKAGHRVITVNFPGWKNVFS